MEDALLTCYYGRILPVNRHLQTPLRNPCRIQTTSDRLGSRDLCTDATENSAAIFGKLHLRTVIQCIPIVTACDEQQKPSRHLEFIPVQRIFDADREAI